MYAKNISTPVSIDRLEPIDFTGNNLKVCSKRSMKQEVTESELNLDFQQKILSPPSINNERLEKIRKKVTMQKINFELDNIKNFDPIVQRKSPAIYIKNTNPENFVENKIPNQ